MSFQHCSYKGRLARGALFFHICPSIDKVRCRTNQASPRGHDERNNLSTTVHICALSNEFHRHGTGPCVERPVQQQRPREVGAQRRWAAYVFTEQVPARAISREVTFVRQLRNAGLCEALVEVNWTLCEW